MPRKPGNLTGPVEDLLKTLSDTEKSYYNTRFKAMFQQADSDLVLEPTIRNIIFSEIFIARLQIQIQNEFSKESPNIILVDKIQKTVNGIQEQLIKSLDSLNLTKAKKDALHKSPESTPSRIISAFALAVSTMTNQERERNKKDIEDAMSRLHSNSDKLLDLIPTDIEESASEIRDEAE